MNRKRTGLAIIAAALLIAVVGGIVSANVMRVGMMDYEVYPCTYNANAGYYVPWDGNAAGQFWISAPRWEWGGEGVSLCADSDGDWRDNGVREGDPNPDFVNEYRRQQSAVNARRAAFSASLVRLEEHREAVATAVSMAATLAATAGSTPGATGVPVTYPGAIGACVAARFAAKRAADPNDRDAHDAADEAYNTCIGRAITNHPTAAQAAYRALQVVCENNNDRSTAQGRTGYQACLSLGTRGGQREGERTESLNFERCTAYGTPTPDPDNPDRTFRLCLQVPIRDAQGTPVMGEDGRVLTEPSTDPNDVKTLLFFDENVPEEERVYTLPIPDPEITLNPETPTTPTPSPTPETAPTVYGQETDSNGNPIDFNPAYFDGGNCDTVIDFIDDYWDSLGDGEKTEEGWMNTANIVRQLDEDNGCDEWEDD